MSQENVEIVRRAWEAFMRRDNEAALALYDRREAREAAGLSEK
jgi:hypothetical protein